mmetsp:Transcript_54624/g.82732  ORF Transcript_54624/g.82732 Transcript_54624/m.82732 type:complete len:80 (+) Transcript_54624:671-910(+)
MYDEDEDYMRERSRRPYDNDDPLHETEFPRDPEEIDRRNERRRKRREAREGEDREDNGSKRRRPRDNDWPEMDEDDLRR